MEIILGRAKTGKSSYIFEKIKQDISSNIKPILFVPSQSRAMTELEYINHIKSDGIIGVDITTISEYTAEFLKSKNIHFDENYISKLRCIPFSSLGKQNGLLLGMKAEEITIIIDDEKKIKQNVIIGIYEKSLTKRGEYRALVGLDLI